MPALFPSGLSDRGCCHILAAWAGLGPRAGVSWGWGSWDMWQPVSPPWYSSAWSCSHGTPDCRCNPTLPHPLQAHSTPKLVDTLGLKSCEKSPWFGYVLVAVFPLSASFLEVPPPTYAAPPANTFLELRFGWRVKDKEEVVVRHRPWMFPRAIYF